jgi:hypothetical protein
MMQQVALRRVIMMISQQRSQERSEDSLQSSCAQGPFVNGHYVACNLLRSEFLGFIWNLLLQEMLLVMLFCSFMFLSSIVRVLLVLNDNWLYFIIHFKLTKQLLFWKPIWCIDTQIELIYPPKSVYNGSQPKINK